MGESPTRPGSLYPQPLVEQPPASRPSSPAAQEGDRVVALRDRRRLPPLLAPGLPAFAAVLREQLRGLEPLVQGEAPGAVADEHHVGRDLHHPAGHGDRMGDPLQGGDAPGPLPLSVHEAGVELDDAVGVGRASEADGVLFGVRLDDADALLDGVQQAALAQRARGRSRWQPGRRARWRRRRGRSGGRRPARPRGLRPRPAAPADRCRPPRPLSTGSPAASAARPWKSPDSWSAGPPCPSRAFSRPPPERRSLRTAVAARQEGAPVDARRADPEICCSRRQTAYIY